MQRRFHRARRSSVWGGSLFVYLVAALPNARAQDSIVARGDASSCTTCVLRLTNPISLRVPDSAAALVSPFTFQQDSRGRFYFNDPFGALGIRVFDSDGRFVRTIGRRGQAPGEFLAIHALESGVGDTLHAFGNAHWVFDSSGKHVRTQSTPELMVVQRLIGLSNGIRLAVGSINTPDAYGQPFHLLGAGGGVVKSFGLAPRSSSTAAWSNQRAVALDRRGGFISGKMNVYELEFWSAGGELRRVLRRETSWFTPWSTWNSRSDLQPPPPRLMAISVDDSGFVWTLSSVADEHWRPNANSERDRGMPTAGVLQQRFDSVIEVIDPRNGDVVARGRFPAMLIAMTEPGVVFENIESPDGEVSVRVWRVHLARR